MHKITMLGQFLSVVPDLEIFLSRLGHGLRDGITALNFDYYSNTSLKSDELAGTKKQGATLNGYAETFMHFREMSKVSTIVLDHLFDRSKALSFSECRGL